MSLPARPQPLRDDGSLCAVAERLWEIRYLLRHRALDGHAALTAIATFARHPNRRIRALVVATECDVCDRALHTMGVLAR